MPMALASANPMTNMRAMCPTGSGSNRSC
jgi:hypothetical protein